MPIIIRKKKKRISTSTGSSTATDENTTTVTIKTNTDRSIHNNNNNNNNKNHCENELQLKSKETIEKEVHTAITNLQKGIRKMIFQKDNHNNNNYDDKNDAILLMKSLNDILLHIQHCMIHLQQYLNVLQVGLHCYIYKLVPHIICHTIHQTVSIPKKPLSNHPHPHHHHNNNNNSTIQQQQQQIIQQNNIKYMIQHLFYWLLHLHDGYIYTISGECRHLYDQKQHSIPPKKQFKSQLNVPAVVVQVVETKLLKQQQQQYNKKHETSKKSSSRNSHNNSQLYSSENIYSGTSWDEYMDPTNGLRHRLLHTILQLQQLHQQKRSTTTIPKLNDYEVLWDHLIEDISSPGYALELIVTHVEQQMQQIQIMFTTLTSTSTTTTTGNNLCRTLQKALFQLLLQSSTANSTTAIPTVTLHWKDKMESLRVTAPSIFGNGTVILERYGNTFHTMKRDVSILPIHFTTINQWWKEGGMECMTTTTTTTTTTAVSTTESVTNQPKRRRIIRTNDDDDDDDDVNNNQNTKKMHHDTKSNTTTTHSIQKSSAPSSIDHTTNLNSGLVVKQIVNGTTNPQRGNDNIATITTTTKNTIKEESVNDIKLQFGINVHDRENAYDIVQAEEAGATHDAERIDHDEYILGGTTATSLLQIDDEYRNHTNNGIMEVVSDLTIDDEVEYALQRLKRTKRTFIRLLKDATRSDTDNIMDELNSMDINIWNAREVLREAYMSAGDVLLWSVERRKEDEPKNKDSRSSMAIDEQDSVKPLQKALQCFTSAKALVVQQQKLHKVMNPDPSNDVITYTFFCRNLLLLQTKAQINIGIAHIQLGLYGSTSDRDPNRHVQFQMAVKECQTAYNMTIAMDHSIYVPSSEHERNDDDDEQIINRDLLEALQLGAFAIRWKAMALWYLHKKSESFSTISKSISCSLEHHTFIQNIWIDARKASNNAAQKNDMAGLIDTLIDVYLENYYAWTTIADLASQSLERATVASIRESDKSMSFYATLLDYVATSLSNAVKLSRTLKQDLEQSNLIERYNDLCESKRLLPADDIVQSLDDIKEWWKRRVTFANELSTKRQTYTTIERGELFSGVQHQIWEDLPTRNFILQPSTRRSKYNLGGGNVGPSAFSNSDGNRKVTIISDNIKGSKEQNDTQHVKPQRHSCRRWREEMTYDPRTDAFLPHLVYPSIAPPLPPYIQDILKEKSQ